MDELDREAEDSFNDLTERFLQWVELFDEVHEIEGKPVDGSVALEAYLRAYPEEDLGKVEDYFEYDHD